VAFHAFRRQAELSGFEKAALARDRNAIGIRATELPDWLADRSAMMRVAGKATP
jgi:hypothetical protein